MVNESTEKILATLERLKNVCIDNARRGKSGDPMVVFLYVSGHGFTQNGDVHFVTNSGYPINMEKFIRSCSQGKHTKFIAVL